MSPEDLRPFIAGQAARIGQGRSSLAEIAAILERGAYSVPALALVEQHVRASLPAPDVDRARLAELGRTERDLIDAGYSPSELACHPERARQRFSTGNALAQLATAGAALDQAYAPLNAHSEAVDEAVARWYVDHGEPIHAIAVEEAARLKAGRYPETARFLALSRALRLSKPATAALCGVTEDAVAKWRNGSSRPSAAVLRLLEIEAELARRSGGEQGAGTGE